MVSSDFQEGYCVFVPLFRIVCHRLVRVLRRIGAATQFLEWALVCSSASGLLLFCFTVLDGLLILFVCYDT